jgi:riboflavin kinase
MWGGSTASSRISKSNAICSSVLSPKPVLLATSLAADPDAEWGILEKALFLRGEVKSGYGRGSKKLGFATANLPQFDELLNENCIERGVYFGWGRICNDNNKMETYQCVANIGKSPTFEGMENPITIVEVHFLDNNHSIDGDFYGDDIRIALVGFLRPEKKFDKFDALIEQINNDVKCANTVCKELEEDSSRFEIIQEYLQDNEKEAFEYTAW